jgi:lysophospholipase L1-like esterase
MKWLVPACVALTMLAAEAVADGDRLPTMCDDPALPVFTMAPTDAAGRLARTPTRVVAFGSSSTYGTGASGERATYPARLAVELRQRFPGGLIEVVNSGVPGDDARMMLDRLDRDVLAQHPDLVIWQVGTNDIERGVPRVDLDRMVRDGIERLRAAGITVVLMETQWYPKLGERTGWQGYRADLIAAADDLGVPLIRRYDMMMAWMAQGGLGAEHLLAGDRFHMKDLSYGCLARAIADGLARAAPPSLTATVAAIE